MPHADDTADPDDVDFDAADFDAADFDAADFDAFYHGLVRRLVRQTFLLTGDLTEAEDVVAEAFERAWLRWPMVRDLDSPEAWVRTVARRLAVSSSGLGQTTMASGSHPRCASPPGVPAPELTGLRQLSVQPRSPDSCLDWWSVDVFVDGNNQIRGVTLDLGSP